MLVLIYGITGIAGQACAQAALRSGHQVRRLGRNPDKLSKEIIDRLKGFIKMADIYDVAALDEATKHIDAIISADHCSSEVVVDGQILLLRAAERAGVKIFHGASWNYDWSKIQLGDCESCDSYIAFRNHARLSSPIKPIYGFVGTILESMFYHVPSGNSLNRQQKTFSYFGSGNEIWTYTALENLTAYTV
ncbi:hypothetical protein AK830_g5118 [Neonectria ditissima]|uniref:NmrA-like domain-containing protein n=1 Tax=Neonectria ditissima TaxID=78410 RepID=A0A0P7B628_9HYPO|nr:hypothetical protein AK830_g5118 [Neonectria ditissima]